MFSLKKAAVISVAVAMIIGPLTASAATVAELQAQLNALMLQLSKISGQQSYSSIGDLPTSSTETAADCQFNRDLFAGVRGTDVQCLQDYLIEEGYLKVAATGYFGTATKTAVSNWQNRHDIPASGYFGKVSRSTYASIAANKPTAPSSEENAPVTGTKPPVYCAQVAKQCSDGSYVGYKPGTCEYYACPYVAQPTNPTLSYISPSTATAGQVVYVYGTNFDYATYVAVDGVYGTVVTPVVANSTILSFTIPTSLSIGNHTIQVAQKAGNGVLSNVATLTVTTPSGTAPVGPTIIGPSDYSRWTIGETKTFTWNTGSAPTSATGYIDLVGSAGTYRIANISNTGSYTWSSVGTINGANVPAGEYSFKLIINGYGDIGGPLYLVAPTTESATSQLSISTSPLGASANRAPVLVDDMGVITLAADHGSSVTVNSLAITLSGDALKAVGITGVSLIDTVTGTQVFNSAVQTCSVSSNYCRVVFGNLNVFIGAGATKQFKVRVNSSSFGVTSYGSNNLLVTVGVGDISWTNATGTNPLGNTSVLYIANVSYQAGSGAASIIREVAFNPSVTAGTTYRKIAQFNIYAPANQSMTVNSITLSKGYDAGFDLQNLSVIANGYQAFGTTRAAVGDSESSMIFSSSQPVSIPQNTSVGFAIYADILNTSTGGTHTSPIDIIGWTATGSTSGSAIAFPGTLEGPDVYVTAAATNPSNVSVTTAVGGVISNAVIMGSTNNEVLRIRLTADGSADLRVTDVTVSDSITNGLSGVPSFQNMSLYNGSTLLAGPLSMAMSGASAGTISFTLTGSGLNLPRNSSAELIIRGDVATFSSGGAVSGSVHTFSVSSGNIHAITTSGVSVNYTGSAIGSPITVYRTKLSVTGSANLTTSRSPIAGPDDIALVNFSADNAYQAQLNGIRFTFSGSAIAGTSPFSVDLIDVNTGVSLGSVSAQTCTVNGNSCSVVFNPNYVISAGTTKTVKIRVNSGNFVTNNGSGTTLSVIVNATNDMNWSDGANTSIGIEPILVPIQIATVQYH